MDFFGAFFELAKTEYICPCCNKKTILAATIYSIETYEFYCVDCFMKLHKQGKA